MSFAYKDIFEHNLELTKQRLVEEIESPSYFEWIPQNAMVINLPKDSPELLRANLDIAIKLINEHDKHPIVLIPEHGFEMPWQEIVPVVSGKRIVNIEPVQDGIRLDLSFDDGTKLMFVITQQPDFKGNKQPVISVGIVQ